MKVLFAINGFPSPSETSRDCALLQGAVVPTGEQVAELIMSTKGFIAVAGDEVGHDRGLKRPWQPAFGGDEMDYSTGSRQS